MMNVQTSQRVDVTAGRVLRFSRGGELEVVSGRVWLTRLGDDDDHVLGAGQRFRLGASHDALVESWQPDQSAQIRWRPRAQSWPLRAAADVLRGLAKIAAAGDKASRSVAHGFASLANRAASGASRAQGCV